MKKEETIERLKSIKSRIGWDGYENDCSAIDTAIEILEKEMEENTENKLSEKQEEVLGFIHEFLYNQGEDNAETLRYQFRAGYCLHFAEMLKAIFRRGEVCWCSGLGHMVWVDDDGTPYDIEGINESECDYYIPISYISQGLDDFRHIPGTWFNASEEYIQNAIKTYEMNIHYTKRVDQKVMTVDLIYEYMKETGKTEIEISYLKEMIEFILEKTRNKKFDFELEIEEKREEIFNLIKLHYMFSRNEEKIESIYCINEERVPEEINELIKEFIKSKKTISFIKIKEPNIAIHFNSKKELDMLIDYLDEYGYEFGTGGSSVQEIKDYTVAHFSGSNYLSLTRDKARNNYVSCGLGYQDKKYEFSEIDFGF